MLDGDPFPHLIVGFTMFDIADCNLDDEMPGVFSTLVLPELCYAVGLDRPPISVQIIVAKDDDELTARVEAFVGENFKLELAGDSGEDPEEVRERMLARRAEHDAESSAKFLADPANAPEDKAAVQAVRPINPSMN